MTKRDHVHLILSIFVLVVTPSYAEISLNNCEGRNNSANSITFNWSSAVVIPANNKTIFYILRNGSSTVANISGKSYQASNLRAASLVVYTLQAYQGNQSSNQITCSAWTVPAAPRGLTTNSWDQTWLSVSWDSSQNGAVNTSFVTWTDLNATSSSSTTSTSKSTQQYNVTSLTAGHTYNVCVVVQSFNKNSSSSCIIDTTAPPDPEPCIISVINSTSVNVTWSPVFSATRYLINFTNGEFRAVSDTWLFVNDLIPGSLNKFFLQAQAPGGWSSIESCSSSTVPLPPIDVRMIGTSKNSLKLTWSIHPQSSQTSFVVSYQKCDEDTKRPVSYADSCTQTSCDIRVGSNDPAGSTYIAYVYSVSSDKKSLVSTSNLAFTVPQPPLWVDCNGITSTDLMLNITRDGNVDYSVLTIRCPLERQPSERCNETFDMFGDQYKVTGLKPQTLYEFDIISVRSMNHTSISSATANVSAFCLISSTPVVLRSLPYELKCSTLPSPLTVNRLAIGLVLGIIMPLAVVTLVAIYCVRRHKVYRNQSVKGKLTEAENNIISSSKPVPLCSFSDHVMKLAHDCGRGYLIEYEDLHLVGKDQSVSAAVEEYNKKKNRYTNILPYDVSRVKLLPIGDQEGSDYINANWISGCSSRKEYIATQGPLPDTVDNFWRMVWEFKCPCIVMLTKCVEFGRTKCEKYWPNETSLYGDLQITSIKEKIMDKWEVRELRISLGCQSRKVDHFFFTDWPDCDIPHETKSLVSFIKHVRSNYPNRNEPIVVHCSAGVGRTGTFIAIDTLLRQIEQVGNTSIDVFGVIYKLRMNRMYMVQTEKQYIFIHDTIHNEIKAKTAQLPDDSAGLDHDKHQVLYENFMAGV